MPADQNARFEYVASRYAAVSSHGIVWTVLYHCVGSLAYIRVQHRIAYNRFPVIPDWRLPGQDLDLPSLSNSRRKSLRVSAVPIKINARRPSWNSWVAVG